jgi:hypothetical protein
LKVILVYNIINYGASLKNEAFGSNLGKRIAFNRSMKTKKIKKETKSTKIPMSKLAEPEEALVMHTWGGEMPKAKRGRNLEYLNARAVFSKKARSEKKSKLKQKQ